MSAASLVLSPPMIAAEWYQVWKSGVPVKYQGRSAESLASSKLPVASYKVDQLRYVRDEYATSPQHGAVLVIQWHHLCMRDDETQRQDRREGQDVPTPIAEAV
ncbi:hypothetical protein ACHAQJ_007423 [Trichoderma viride]